jgi:hypothetical protein
MRQRPLPWKQIAGAVLTAVGLVTTTTAVAVAAGNPHTKAFTMAVYGDAPYGTTNTDTSEFLATPAFIDSVNNDPDVSTVVHVGDVHSGKQNCTEAYDWSIYGLWAKYADPLVYTPGDNEWTDCHKSGEGGNVTDPNNGQPVDYTNGNPVANLSLIRRIFFANPGQTLGRQPTQVRSQAQLYDRQHPTDAQYVENVRWERGGTLFVTINVPGGSNNDADPWYGAATPTSEQTTEAANRTAADIRWLDAAFAQAQHGQDGSVVIFTQADMWDLDGKTADHVANYEPIIAHIANDTTAFAKPVLLFNGDSHVYRSDNPLVQNAPCTGDADVCSYDAWQSHPSYNVPHFHRVVVHGSTFPLEWLKLTVDPTANYDTTAQSFGPFSWTRMPQS